MKRGKLITFEGLDASGKETNIKKIEKELNNKGYNTIVFQYPNYDSVIGKIIANYLQGKYNTENFSVSKEIISAVFAADRAKDSNKINEYLNKGYIVLCDRYTYSNIYNLSKLPENEWDKYFEWFEDLEFNCMNVIKPDYNIYLHVDPNISIKRIIERGKREYQEGNKDINESDNDLLFKTSKAYLYFANKFDNWIIIDEMENNEQISKEQVFQKINVEISKLLL